jgi:CHAT domain-containing protein
VLQDAVISYAASARLFCDVASREPVPVTGESLIVGDPTGDLPHAGEEAAAIRSQIYPGGRYLGRHSESGAGTPAEVLDWLRDTVAHRRGVLHLACHGAVRTSRPNSSLLFLAGDANGESLSAERLVERAPWAPGACQVSLVCLAACSTGVSSRGYDEAFSLATAFQVAGARTVVSSLWRVPDEATSLLMYMLHHYLAVDHIAPAHALRLAQLWMLDPLRRIPPAMPPTLRTRVPAIAPDDLSGWAGFTHLGQW